VQVLAGAHAHGVDAALAHVLDELDVGALAVGLAALRHLVHRLVDVGAHLALQAAVRVVVVGRVEVLREPHGLGVRHLARRAELVGHDDALLALDGADDEARVRGAQQHLVQVQAAAGVSAGRTMRRAAHAALTRTSRWPPGRRPPRRTARSRHRGAGRRVSGEAEAHTHAPLTSSANLLRLYTLASMMIQRSPGLLCCVKGA
jgi:hypothetical protein